MRAIIAGGTGFIGQALVHELKENGWEIVVLSRSPSKVAEVFGSGVIGMRWDNKDWPDMLGENTTIVNLAGSSIAEGRWTSALKQKILHSRLSSGEIIVNAVKNADSPPAALIQASAVGWYGPRNNTPIDETAPSGSGFLADVARKWEASTSELEDMGVRRCILRSGMVLGNGGALERILPPFRMFMGGPLGSGFQGLSWIHMFDEINAIRFLMENTETNGAYNLTAPTPVSSRKFAHILGTTLNRPYKLAAPASVLKIRFGQMAEEVLLEGQFVLPTRLIEAGYTFSFPTLDTALADLLT